MSLKKQRFACGFLLSLIMFGAVLGVLFHFVPSVNATNWLAGWLYRSSTTLTEGIAPAGTVAVTNGNTAVVGTGTNFAKWVVGDKIKLPDANWYTIATITDNTHLTISISYPGGSLSGQSYKMDRINYQEFFKVYYSSTGSGTEAVRHLTAGYWKCNSHCQTDFGDLRFTSSDGSTLLDFWIESSTSSTSALIWVELPELMSDTSTTIYMYYGHGSVQTTTSSGNAVFRFFDHFLGSSLNSTTWKNVTGVGTITVSSSLARFVKTSTNGGYPYAYMNTATRQMNTEFAGNVKANSFLPLGQVGFNARSVETGNSVSFYNVMGDTSSWQDFFADNNGDGSYEVVLDKGSWTANVVYILSAITTDINIKQYRNISPFNNTYTYGTGVALSQQTKIMLDAFVGTNSGINTIDLSFDWVFVRYCVSTEPTHGAWTSEETPAAPLNWTNTLNSPSDLSTSTAWSVAFKFTPAFGTAIMNASLRITNTTVVSSALAWSTNHWNTSKVTNNTQNTITFSFSSNGEGTYKWNVRVYNSTGSVYAASNFTLTVDIPPQYRSVGSNSSSISLNGTIKLYAQGYDGVGLDQAWLSTNETGAWKNYTEATLYVRWYRGHTGPPTKIGFANSTNGVTWVKYENNPILGLSGASGGYAYPMVVRDPGTDRFYMFVQNLTTGYMYLYNVTSWKSPVLMNSGKPVYKPSANIVDWDYSIENPAVAIVGGTWHLIMEGKPQGDTFRIGYAYSNLTELNWTAHRSSYKVIYTNKDVGNPFLCYVPERNALLALYGNTTIANQYWHITGSYASLSDDLTLASSWHQVSTSRFLIQDASVHDADPSMMTDFNSTYPIMISYTSHQEYVYQQYCSLTLKQFYDACVYGNNTITLVAESSNPTLTHTASWEASEVTEQSDFLFSTTPSAQLMDLGGVKGVWTWTNWTWHNSSITNGQVITWKIYYQDTFGNKNVTSVYSFSVNAIPKIAVSSLTTVYAYQSVMLNVTVRDDDGRSDLHNCTLSLSVGSIDLTWTESTNVTAIVDPSNFGQLDSALVKMLNTTSYKITWTVRFYWNFTEGSVTADSGTKVFDDTGNSASATGALFTFEEDLIVASASVNDSVSNPSQGLKFTGQLYYQGTSTGPYSTSGITARVYLGAASKGSNSSIASDGTFTISFSAQSSVGNSTYTVFSTTDQNSVQNGTVWSIAEQIRVYWEQLLVNHTNINASLNGRYRAALVFIGHGLGSGDSLSCSWAALSWVGGSNWWAVSHAESTACAVTVSGWTGSEATYGITSVVENITETSYIYDTLVVYSLQAVQYVGNGGMQYQARIKYGCSGGTISGAKVNVTSPSGNIGQALSNSTGWIRFVLDQNNATVQGTYTIFGVNDMVYIITVAGANQTFSLNKWMLNVTDVDGNSLSNSVVRLEIGSSEVYNGTLTVFHVPSATFNVTITWYSLSMNTTTNLAVSGDTNTTLSCRAYPYLVESVRYWVASNCTISSASIASSVLTVSFPNTPGTYLLIASCTTRPSYILNTTYNMASVWGTYLSLTHYGNATLKIGYESWGGFYVSSTDKRMTICSWIEQQLSMTFQGTTGQTGTVKLYVSSRGSPAEYIGFSTGVYSGSTLTWTGTYAFASPASVSLNWISSGGTSSGGGTSGPLQGNILVYVEYLLASRIGSGSVTSGTVKVSWSGPFVIYVYDIYLGDNTTLFELEGMALPLKLERPRGLAVSDASFPIYIRVPADLATGNYTVPCKLVFRTELNTEVTDVGTVEFSVIGQPSSVPEYMTLLFLGVIGCIFAIGLFRRKRT
jgi:hypothetical protein